MQRGLYGRAESPYNGDYLTSAFGSGSSNGSGTATAASFAAFGLGEETWSSGRGARLEQRALRLHALARRHLGARQLAAGPHDGVVVPHTRTMADLLEVLDVLVADDTETRGDFWRAQPWRPAGCGRRRPRRSMSRSRRGRGIRLSSGRRFGVPAMYLGDGSGCRHGAWDRRSHR